MICRSGSLVSKNECSSLLGLETPNMIRFSVALHDLYNFALAWSTTLKRGANLQDAVRKIVAGLVVAGVIFLVSLHDVVSAILRIFHTDLMYIMLRHKLPQLRDITR